MNRTSSSWLILNVHRNLLKKMFYKSLTSCEKPKANNGRKEFRAEIISSREQM